MAATTTATNFNNDLTLNEFAKEVNNSAGRPRRPFKGFLMGILGLVLVVVGLILRSIKTTKEDGTRESLLKPWISDAVVASGSLLLIVGVVFVFFVKK